MSNSQKTYEIDIQSHWSIEDKPLSFFVDALSDQENRADPFAELYSNYLRGDFEEIERETLFLLYLLKDLKATGWAIKGAQDKLILRAPKDNDPEATRNHHELIRNDKLLEFSNRDFIRLMETPRKNDVGLYSIFSVFRDGQQLAEEIEQANSLDETQRIEKLSSLCKPYVCLIEDDERCPHTGLKLREIFRYLRTTWSSTYTSAPTRQLSFLIRDAAAQNHPIIGIAEMRSSVISQTERDQWIEWTHAQVIADLKKNAGKKNIDWLRNILDENLAEIRVDDFLNEGLITNLDLKYPSKKVCDVLSSFAEKELRDHRNEKSDWRLGEDDYLSHSKTKLFRSKRANTLAELLLIKDKFQQHGLDDIKPAQFRRLLNENKEFVAVIQKLISIIKSNNAGIHMMDITTAGAVAPYNHLLGGKLVCMLLTSPEVVQFYNQRYSQQSSDIASKMAGRPIIKTPQLSILNTTSLYGRNSSQYNRIKIPTKEVLKSGDDEIVYKKLGVTKGVGTNHLSEKTKNLMEAFLLDKGSSNRRTNIMGEGTSPLMRSLREAARFLDFPNEIALEHGNKRILYGISLASNMKDVMLGKTKKARYLLGNDKRKTKAVIDWWKRRWFYSRCARREVIDALDKESLAYPITHNARSPLYKILKPEPNLELDL